jgi:hypothetical protein
MLSQRYGCGVALPQYAGTKQKVLEVFARGTETYSFEGRGSIYTFDDKGYLNEYLGEHSPLA